MCVCIRNNNSNTTDTVTSHKNYVQLKERSERRESNSISNLSFSLIPFPSLSLSLSLSLSFSPSSTSSLPFLYFSRVLFSSRPWPSVLGFFSFFSLSFSTIHTIRSNSWRKNKRNNCQASLVSLSVSRNYNQLSFKKTRKDTRKTKTFFF